MPHVRFPSRPASSRNSAGDARPGTDPFRLPSRLARAGVALRREDDGDHALTRAIYAAARADELAQVDWPAAMLDAFLDNQFAAQGAHYRLNHPGADHWIVMRHGSPIGRFYVERRDGDWRLLDIALLPEARGQGIGGALVTALMRAARRDGAGVALSVARDNPRAEALYCRLGFVEVIPVEGAHATHRAMRCAGSGVS